MNNFQKFQFSHNIEGNYQDKWFKVLKKQKKKKKGIPSWLLFSFKKLYKFNKKHFVKIWACLFVAAVSLNLWYLQPINWNQFQSIFNKSLTKSKGFIAVLIFGFSFFLINDIILAKWSYSGRIFPEIEKKISTVEWLKLHSVSFLIRSFTPFSIGSEPYVIWWLRRKGIPLRRGASIVSSLTISWFLAQGIVTWPSFIYLHSQNSWNSNSAVLKYYWMMVIGLLIDLISSIFVFSISYSQKVHYFFALTKYKFNSFFRIPNSKTIFEIRWKYLKNKTFKKYFERTFFNVLTIRAVIVFTIQNILNYSLFALFSSAINQNWTNFLNNFHIINISTTSNNFVPTPGSEGSIQFTIDKMNSLISNNSGCDSEWHIKNNESKINETIFLWRWSQKYQPLILSSIFLSIYYSYSWMKLKIKKYRSKKDIYPELTSLYTVNGSSTL